MTRAKDSDELCGGVGDEAGVLSIVGSGLTVRAGPWTKPLERTLPASEWGPSQVAVRDAWLCSRGFIVQKGGKTP